MAWAQPAHLFYIYIYTHAAKEGPAVGLGGNRLIYFIYIYILTQLKKGRLLAWGQPAHLFYIYIYTHAAKEGPAVGLGATGSSILYIYIYTHAAKEGPAVGLGATGSSCFFNSAFASLELASTSFVTLVEKLDIAYNCSYM